MIIFGRIAKDGEGNYTLHVGQHFPPTTITTIINGVVKDTLPHLSSVDDARWVGSDKQWVCPVIFLEER
jgi:hypothetical protein